MSFIGHSTHIASSTLTSWEVQSSPMSGREGGQEIVVSGSDAYHMGEHSEFSKQVCAPGDVQDHPLGVGRHSGTSSYIYSLSSPF